MAVDFKLGEKLAGFGRDSGRVARDYARGVIESSRRPGPEIKVDHFGPNDVTTAAGFIRVGAALMKGARDRANFEATQRKAALDQTYTEAMTDRLRAASEADRARARGSSKTYVVKSPGGTDYEFDDPAQASAAENRFTTDKTRPVAYRGQTYNLTEKQAADFALDQTQEQRRQENADKGLTQMQQVTAANIRAQRIDSALQPGGSVDQSVRGEVASEMEGLMKRIFQPETARFDQATADSARAVIGMAPHRGRTPGGDEATMDAFDRWRVSETARRRGAVADSLLSERRFAEQIITGAMQGLDPTQAVFLEALKGMKGASPADTTRR